MFTALWHLRFDDNLGWVLEALTDLTAETKAYDQFHRQLFQCVFQKASLFYKREKMFYNLNRTIF